MDERHPGDKKEELNILPCPFCGNKKPFISPYFSKVKKIYMYGVVCKVCRAGVHHNYKTKKDALAVWNERNTYLNPRNLEAGVKLIKTQFSTYKHPPLELPPDSLIEACLIQILGSRDGSYSERDIDRLINT